MDASVIAAHITNIEALKGKNAEEILPILEKFPYSSTLYILYLKALANDKSIDFESQLRVAAAHVSDREHLYHLINGNNSVVEENPKELAIEEIVISDAIEEIVVKEEEIVEQEVAPINEVLEVVEEIEEKEEEREIEIELKKIDPIVAEEIVEETNIEIDESSLKEEIFSHAIAEAFEVSSEEIIKEIVEDKEPVVANSEKASEAPEDMTFIDWLQFKKTGNTGTSDEQFAKAEKEEIAVEKENIQTKIEKEITEVEKVDEKRMSKKEINALLDKFISEQPRISRPTKETFDLTSNAKQSVEESSELVSETLAQIHVMQGNYSKAIRAYKQLSLLYPEKKVFFATQIKKIKSKLS
jgi:hypothetical protein